MSEAIANTGVISPHVSAQTVTWVKRSRYNPIRQLNPDYLARIIDIWKQGFLREFSLMAEAIKDRDDMIGVCLRKREKAVSRHGFEVLINDGLDDATKARAEEHAAALRYFYDHCTATDVLDQDKRGGFTLLVRQMMEAVGYRYSVHEIVWTPIIDPLTGQRRLTASFNHVPAYFFEATTGKLRFIRRYYGTVMGEDMSDDDWLVTIGEGIMEALSVCYMYKTMSLKDWVAYSERFGAPGILGKTTAAQNSPAWNTMADAVASFGQDWAAVCNSEGSIELVEAKGGTSMPFEPLVQRMDRAIASVCRGADLSTMSSGHMGAGGQGRGASVQADESTLLEEDDAEMISETLQSVSRKVIQYLYGEPPLAYVQIIVPEKKDNADTINKLGFLVQNGVPVAQAYAQKELGVPPPAPDEPLLVKPQAPEPDLAETMAVSNASHAQVDAGEAVFRANAARRLSQAETDAVRPVLDRIASLRDLPPDQLANALTQFRSDLPRLFAEARLKVPGIAEVWEQVLGTALVDGLAEAPKPATP